jgi:hypothetical protein
MHWWGGDFVERRTEVGVGEGCGKAMIQYSARVALGGRCK